MENINRDYIMRRAINECMSEMYAKACPSADWNALCKNYEVQYLDAEKRGDTKKLDELKKIRIYERYYLPHEEFNYILDKYKKAYGFKENWRPNVDIVLEYLTKGGSKDKYIDSYTDENGNYHTGYRGYEKVPPLKEQMENIMTEFDCSDAAKEIVETLYNVVIETIQNCRDFYQFDRDESTFSINVCLGASPTSNIETAKKYWREQAELGVEGAAENLQALESYKPTNPLLYWEKDEYGDEFEEIMREEEGDDWEEIWKARYEEQQMDKT